MHIWPPKPAGSWNFQLLKIQDGGRLPSWKIEKSPYLGRGLCDFDKIWHTDVVRPSWAYRLKFEISKIQDGGGRHLENSKIGHVSGTVRPIFAKFGTMTHIGPPNRIGSWNFRLLKIQVGGPPSWKIAISHPRFERFRHNLTHRRSLTLLSVPTVKNMKFPKSKMAAAAILKNRKSAISAERFDRSSRNLARWRIFLPPNWISS